MALREIIGLTRIHNKCTKLTVIINDFTAKLIEMTRLNSANVEQTLTSTKLASKTSWHSVKQIMFIIYMSNTISQYKCIHNITSLWPSCLHFTSSKNRKFQQTIALHENKDSCSSTNNYIPPKFCTGQWVNITVHIKLVKSRILVKGSY